MIIKSSERLFMLLSEHKELFSTGLCSFIFQCEKEHIITFYEYCTLREYINMVLIHKRNMDKAYSPYYWRKGDYDARIQLLWSLFNEKTND